MENRSPSDADKAFATPAQRARNLVEAIAGYFPASPVAQAETSIATPRFGSIYKGPLPSFAKGVPHYGMVKQGAAQVPGKRCPSPVIPFAPISSQAVKRNRLNQVLSLPAGTLPPKNCGDDGIIHVVSHILLYLTIPLSHRQMRHLIDKEQMWYVKTLDDSFLKKARTILANI